MEELPTRDNENNKDLEAVNFALTASRKFKTSDIIPQEEEIVMRGISSVKIYPIIIETRPTSFEVYDTQYKIDPQNSANLIPMSDTLSEEKPFSFQVFEDSESFQRIFVKPEFLAIALERDVFSCIRQLHGPKIIYNSLELTSYSQKEWDETNTYCETNPLSEFARDTIAFKASVVGLNPNDFVNHQTNLLFTAQFPESALQFYKTNRFVTCSAFPNEQAVALATPSAIFDKVEVAFGKDVGLSQGPTIKLRPIFERGNIIQLSNEVYFSGLVSNASGS